MRFPLSHMTDESPWLVPLAFTLILHLIVPVMLQTGHLLFRTRYRLPEVYTVTLFNAEEMARPAPKSPSPAVTQPPVSPPPASVAPRAISLKPKKFLPEKTKKKKKKMADPVIRQRSLDNALEKIRAKREAEQAEREAEKAVSKALEAIKSTLVRPSADHQTVSPAKIGGAIGSGAASTGLDAVTTTYYSSLVLLIQQNWVLPELQSWKKDMEAVLVVKVRRDGLVTDMFFERKSDNAYFNQFVMKAVNDAAPLPPFPEKMKESEVEFGFVFHPSGLL